MSLDPDVHAALLSTIRNTADWSTIGVKSLRKQLATQFDRKLDKKAFKAELGNAINLVQGERDAAAEAAPEKPSHTEEAALVVRRAKTRESMQTDDDDANDVADVDAETAQGAGGNDGGDDDGDDDNTFTAATAAINELPEIDQTTAALRDVFGDAADDLEPSGPRSSASKARAAMAEEHEAEEDDDDSEADAVEMALFGAVNKKGKRGTKRRRRRAAVDDDDDFEAVAAPKRKRSKTSTKRPKKAAAKRKPKKKSIKNKDGEDELTAPKKTEAEAEVDAVFESLKRKKLVSNKSHQEKVAAAKQFLERMDHYAQEDARLISAKMPALNKLKNLSAFVENLNKVEMQTYIIGNGGLQVIRNWLEPLPNGSLPSIPIRTKLLECLFDLPVEREDLLESGIGKIVKYLRQSNKEVAKNRELCKKLMTKWTRPVFALQGSYSQMELPEKYERAPQTALLATSLSRGTGQKYTAMEAAVDDTKINPLTGRMIRPRVSVPQPARLNFTKLPANRVERRNVAVPTERKKELQSRINNLKTKKQSFKRMHNVAITKLHL